MLSENSKEVLGKSDERGSYIREFEFLREKNVWLIEGKVIGRFDSIGQILVYRELFQEDWPKAKISLMGIVACRFEDRFLFVE